MTVVRQRGDRDCGVAALAMLAAIAYEDAYVAVAHIDPLNRGKQGLRNRDLVAAARRLGLALSSARRYDLDEDEGILRVRFSGRRAKELPGGHFVAVRLGFVHCPSDGFPTPWRDYFERWGARPCTLLQGTP